MITTDPKTQSMTHKDTHYSPPDLTHWSLEQIDKEIDRLTQHKQQRLADSLTQKPTSKVGPYQQKKAVVVGGKGQLGRLFVKLFTSEFAQVEVLESSDWERSESILTDADLVLVAVPIHVTESVIKQLKHLPEQCILADVTSIKQMPVKAMCELHKGPVVGLHPMFGPDIDHIAGQTIVVCDGRGQKKYQWLLDFLNQHQAKLQLISAQDHDHYMAFIQVLRHFSTLAYGVHLAAEDPKVDDILALSSPIYRLELAMVGRLFAQAPELYTEIIFANPENFKMIERYIDQLNQLLTLLKQQDKQAIIDKFIETRHWFGGYADTFMKESQKMLRAIQATSE